MFPKKPVIVGNKKVTDVARHTYPTFHTRQDKGTRCDFKYSNSESDYKPLIFLSIKL